MIKATVTKLFGTKNQRFLKTLQPIVNYINDMEPEIKKLSDEELKEKIQNYKADIIRRTEAGETLRPMLDEIMPEVFAIVKDTCRRLLGYEYDVRGNKTKWEMVPFDVQLIGAIVLHKGVIAEMATGEGKTLVATLPLFLNALLGQGAHLITVNDYLAQRDSEWMTPIFEFHGLEVGCITTGMANESRKAAYDKDVTYGTNSEFGFDYLRDNMAVHSSQLVQRKHQYAIVDEVDSVLIDEARTPLIISGPVQESKNFFKELRPTIQKLVNAQNALVIRYLREIREFMEQEPFNEEEVGRRLLLVMRAAPRNKSFLKMMKEPELKKLVTDYEGYYMRDKKMHLIDEELFYVVEEKQNSCELSEKGNDLVAQKEPNLFVVEQLDDMIEAVESDETLSFAEKTKKKEEQTSLFMDKSEKLHNIKQLLRAYTLFEKEIDYVVMENKVIIVDQFTGSGRIDQEADAGTY